MKTCPVCLRSITPGFIERHGGYTIFRCPECDVFFSDPMKNPGAGWYETSELYSHGKVFLTDVNWQHRQFLDYEPLPGKRLLDVGCGHGAFLRHASDKGYEVWGVDFDRGNVRIAREKFGLKNVSVKSVEELSRDLSGERFDVVTFFEVLEHLDNPSGFLKDVKGVLKPGGYIALSLPNRDRLLDPLGEGDYPPNHLTKWNGPCLKRFLEASGFDVERCVVKRLDADDLAGYMKSRIRFGIARGMAMRGAEAKDEGEIKKAAGLMKIKDAAFKALSVCFMPFLAVAPLQGTGLYALARYKR